jgi:hypothetical protein
VVSYYGFYVVVIFGIVHFTAVIMPNFVFGLTRFNVFKDFFCDFFFLAQEICFQMILQPESAKN